MFRAIAVLSLITLGACVDMNAPLCDKEPEVNTAADSTVLVTMRGFSKGQSLAVWNSIFNGNLLKYMNAKDECGQCLLPKTQYFLMSQTSLLAGYGDIVL